MGDTTTATMDREVSRAAPEATARPGDGRARAPFGGPAGAETSNRPDTPDILSCWFMTGEELKAFDEISTCSGASAEIAALAEIKADLSTKSGWRARASGDQQGGVLGITISGASTMDAVLRGMDQLA